MSVSRRSLLQSGAVLPLALAEATGAVGPLQPDATAPGAKRSGVELWIDVYRRACQIPGLAAVVVQHGRPGLLALQGYASVGFGVPVTGQTRFHMGSIGKHVTAAAVLRLVETGRARLDAAIGDYVPGLPAAWSDRPLHSLLTHTSGIPDYEDLIVWDRPYSHEEFLKLAASRPPDFAPGESWSYSNTAYVLLGWMIEALSGRSYSRFVQETFLDHARLQDARCDAAEEVIDNRAEPYEWHGTKLRHAVRMNNELSAWPDGGILISARDVVPWSAALDGGQWIAAMSREAMFTAVRMNTGRTFPYGYGWSLDEVTPHSPIHWHAGSVPGFTSVLLRLPRQQLTVMVLTNIGGHSRPQRYIALRLAEQFAPRATPLALEPLHDRDRSLTDTVRNILFRGSNPLEASRFAPELAVLIRGRLGQRAIIDLSEDLSRLRDLFLVEETTTATQCVRRYRLVYDDHVEHVACGYAPDGRIYYLRLL